MPLTKSSSYTDEVLLLAEKISEDGLHYTGGDGRDLWQLINLLADGLEDLPMDELSAKLNADLVILNLRFGWDHPTQNENTERQVFRMFVALWLQFNHQIPVRTFL